MTPLTDAVSQELASDSAGGSPSSVTDVAQEVVAETVHEPVCATKEVPYVPLHHFDDLLTGWPCLGMSH